MLGYLARFAMTGAVGTGVHYMILILLVEFAQVSPSYSTMFGFLGGAVTNYFLSNYFVFKIGRTSLASVVKFICMALFGFILNQAIFMASYVYVPYLVAQIIATGCVFVVNFLVSKYWVFTQPKPSSE